MVVELFTSQGCIHARAPTGSWACFREGVLALTFPVGIWDYLGWHDTFAQDDFHRSPATIHGTLRARALHATTYLQRLASDQRFDWGPSACHVRRAAHDGLAGECAERFHLAAVMAVRVTVPARANAPPSDVWLVSVRSRSGERAVIPAAQSQSHGDALQFGWAARAVGGMVRQFCLVRAHALSPPECAVLLPASERRADFGGRLHVFARRR